MLKATTIEAFQKYLPTRDVAAFTNDESGTSVDSDILESVNQAAVADFESKLYEVSPDVDLALVYAEPIADSVRLTIHDLMHYHLYQRRNAESIPESIMALRKYALERVKGMKRLFEKKLSATPAQPLLTADAPPARFGSGWSYDETNM
jgi:hypothetical protein